MRIDDSGMSHFRPNAANRGPSRPAVLAGGAAGGGLTVERLQEIRGLLAAAHYDSAEVHEEIARSVVDSGALDGLEARESDLFQGSDVGLPRRFAPWRHLR